MKRFVAILFLVCSIISLYGQSYVFDNAMKKGRKPGTWYSVNPSKNEHFTKKEIVSFAEKNGYSIRNLKEGWINRFGDMVQGVVYVEFLPKSELQAYNNEVKASSGSGSKSTSVPNAKTEYLEENTASLLALCKKALKKDKEYYSHHVVDIKQGIIASSSKELLDYLAKKENYYISFVEKNDDGSKVMSLTFFPLSGWGDKQIPQRPLSKREKEPIISALKAGLAKSPDKNGFYTARFSRTEISYLREEEKPVYYNLRYLNRVLSEEGYFIAMDIDRAGKDASASEIKFASKSDYERILLGMLSHNKGMYPINSQHVSLLFYNRNSGKFEELDDIIWAGNVANGKAEGEGKGMKIDNGYVYYVSGKFRNGKMDGSGRFEYMPLSTAMGRDKDTLYSVGIKMSRFSENMSKLELNGRGSDPAWERNNWGAKQFKETLYINSDYQPQFIMPSNREVRYVQDSFQNGSIIIRHSPNENLDTSGKWAEYTINDKGVYSFTEAFGNRLLDAYDDIMHYWPQMQKLFEQGFPSPYEYAFMPGSNLYSCLDYWEDLNKSCKFDDPGNYIRKNRSDYFNFLAFQKLIRLYDIRFSTFHSSDWNFDSKLSSAKQKFERSDYKKRNLSFNPDRYINSGWMSSRVAEAQELIAGISNNTGFNPKDKERILSDIAQAIQDLETEYNDKAFKALSSFYASTGGINLQSELSGEAIDLGSSTAPSGKLVHPSSSSSYNTFNDSGEIRFKTTLMPVKYNIMYNSSGELEYYYITFPGHFNELQSKQFKSYGEMIDAINKAYANSSLSKSK